MTTSGELNKDEHDEITDNGNANTDDNDREDAYIPPPLVSQATILTVGGSLYITILLLFVTVVSLSIDQFSLLASSSQWSSSRFLAVIIMLFPFMVIYQISKFCAYCFRINDDPVTRRKLVSSFEQSDPIAKKIVLQLPPTVSYVESYWTNERGMVLQTAIMNPTTESQIPVKAVVCYCHGYSDNVCYSKRKVLSKLVENGISVILISYEGHGKSDGTLGLVTNFDTVVKDVCGYFQYVLSSKQHQQSHDQPTSNGNNQCNDIYKGKKVFLMGESMGGAVAFRVYEQLPYIFSGGVIFISPMCKISNAMLPPQWIIDLGTYLAGPTGTSDRLGYFPISPAKGDLKKLSFRLANKRKYITRVPSAFGRNPRLATARELLVSFVFPK